LKRWDTNKNLLNRLSHWAPLDSFYHGLKLKAELLGSLSGFKLYIFKGSAVH